VVVKYYQLALGTTEWWWNNRKFQFV